MDQAIAASCLGELGNEIRLAIFRYLVKAGPTGAAVGEIQKALDVPASTLSHHLNRMVSVDLITQRRESRSIICCANIERLAALIDFLQEECCVGHASC